MFSSILPILIINLSAEVEIYVCIQKRSVTHARSETHSMSDQHNVTYVDV